MDISSIEQSFKDIFSLSYSVARDVFDTEPIDATPRVQRKIRKWINKTYLSGISLTKSVEEFTNKSVSDFDFITFVKACFDFEQTEGAKKKQLFDVASADLSDDVKNAIWGMLQGQICYGNLHKSGNDVKIGFGFGTNYDSSLCFINASGMPEYDYDCFYLIGDLTKENGVYKISGETEHFDNESVKSFAIEFTDAKIEVNVYNAVEAAGVSEPWIYLCSIAGEILHKNSFSEKYLNQKEKTLLPLAKEIYKLSYWIYTPEKFDVLSFENLKEHVKKHGYPELLAPIEKIEKAMLKGKKCERLIRKLISTLNKQKYEPLWREIYYLFAKSQAGYPSRVEAHCPKELLSQTRSDIQKLMESLGYSGTYPDFQKCISHRGLRLEDSYSKSYFISNEKTVICRIHCDENYFENYLSVLFVCATEFIRNNEPAKDVYSCLFDCGGNRLFSTLRYDSENVYGDEEPDDLEQIVTIAAKTAELKKLTRQEKKKVVNYSLPYWKVFSVVFIVFGGLFGAFMTAGFMLIELLVALIFGEIHQFPALFMSTPWWAILAFSWAAFGGISGILTIMAFL